MFISHRVGLMAVVGAICLSPGDLYGAARQIAPTTSASGGEPWVANSSPSQKFVEAQRAAFKRATNDQQRWVAFSELCNSAIVSDMESWHGILSCLDLLKFDEVSGSVSFRSLFAQFAAIHAGGYAPPWGVRPDRMSLVRRSLVIELFRSDPGQLSSVERQMAKAAMIELCQFAGDNDRASCESILAWGGWSAVERREFAETFLVNSKFYGSERLLLGRDDDGLEPVIRAEVVRRWSQERSIAFDPIGRLIARDDATMLPILQSIKASILADGGMCDSTPCTAYLYGLEQLIWEAQMITASPATLLDVIENNPEGSAAFGYPRGDRMREVACRRLLASGVDVSTIRKSFMAFVGKLNASRPPNEAWSRPLRSLSVLKGKLMFMGILSENDLPDVREVRFGEIVPAK